MINPYELLGASYSITKEDLKKRYYELALFMHPDKGGCAEDMICLQKAYEYICNELNNVRQISFEQIEEEFQNFLNLQGKAVPPFQDIYAEAFDLPKFNDYFEANNSNVVPAAYPNGYDNLEYASLLPAPVSISPEEIVLEKRSYDMTIPTLSNFTLNDNNLHMSDYQEAYSEPTLLESENQSRQLDEIIKKREMVPEEIKGYMWSFHGFLNEARERIVDYSRITG